MQPISYDAKKAVDEDINSFLQDIQKVDKRLLNAASNEALEGQENKQLRANGASVIEEFEKKKAAENERLKGNECMKAKEYVDAIKCYSRALELHPDDSATFSNRALAHLKTKEYARALEDADAAIKIKEDYIKAYHRRGKAYASLNKLELAIRDFQFILEKEPHNKEAMQEVKNARKKLEDKLKPTESKKEESKAPVGAKEAEKKFVRVAI